MDPTYSLIPPIWAAITKIQGQVGNIPSGGWGPGANDLEAAIRSLLARVTALEQSDHDKEIRIATLEATVETQATQIENLQNALTAEIQTREQTDQQILNTIQQMQANVTQNTNDINSLNTRVTNLENALGTDPNLPALIQRIESLETTVADNHTSTLHLIASLQGQDQTLANEITALQTRVTALENQGNGVDLETIRQHIQELREQQALHGTSIGSNTHNITLLDQRLSAIEGNTGGGGGVDILSLNARLTAVEGKVTTLETTTADLQTTVDGHTTDIANLQQTVEGLNQLGDYLNGFNTRLTTAESDITQLRSDVTTLQWDVNPDNNTSVTTLWGAIKNLRTLLDATNNSLNETISDWSSYWQDYLQFKQTTSDELGTIQASFNALDEYLKNLPGTGSAEDTYAREQIAIINGLISKLQNVDTQLRSEIKELDNKITGINLQLNLINEQISSLSNRVLTLENQNTGGSSGTVITTTTATWVALLNVVRSLYDHANQFYSLDAYTDSSGYASINVPYNDVSGNNVVGATALPLTTNRDCGTLGVSVNRDNAWNLKVQAKWTSSNITAATRYRVLWMVNLPAWRGLPRP